MGLVNYVVALTGGLLLAAASLIGGAGFGVILAAYVIGGVISLITSAVLIAAFDEADRP